MFVRVKTTKNSPRKSVQICESVRQDDKIKQHIVRHIGIAFDEAELIELQNLAEKIKIKIEEERSGMRPLFPPEEIAAGSRQRRKPHGTVVDVKPTENVCLSDLREESRVVEGIHDVFAPLFDEFGFDKILAKGAAQVFKALALARVARPDSKRKTAALLERDFAISIPLEKIYRTLDHVERAIPELQKTVFQETVGLVGDKVDLLFFDVTTLYFESTNEDALRKFGYSKDQKYHCVQVVLALATTRKGLPVGYKLFEGNKAEVSTLIEAIKAWRQNLAIGKVTFVADRAMFSKANLTLLENSGYEYIVAAKLKTMGKDIRRDILDEKGYALSTIGNDLMWTKALDGQHKGRRLICSYSSKRARKDKADREKILEKIIKLIGKKSGNAQRLISNSGYKKFISNVLKENDEEAAQPNTAAKANNIRPEHENGSAQSVQIDIKKIDADAQWDGMHGLITNTSLSPAEAIARYRELWTIEDAFRVTKHDLRVRPIYHFKPDRIRAHVAVCFVAYALIKTAQYRIAIQQISMSPAAIRDELLTVQASIVRDQKTKALYRLPSAMSQKVQAIYKAFGIKRSLAPAALPH